MLASYIARQYAMYAIANQYHQQNTSLVIPSVCFQSDSHVDQVEARTVTCNTSSCDHAIVTSGTNKTRRKQTLQQSCKRVSSEIKFSIDRILGNRSDSGDCTNDVDDDVTENDDGEQVKEDNADVVEYGDDEDIKFSWLNCTRYKPPKLQRMRKKEGGKKRKLGRNPRVPFSQQQVAALEQKFCRTHYLSSMDVVELSTALNLTETRVKIWFQNRRARERRDRDAKRRLCTDLNQPMSNSHVMYTSSPSATPSAWEISRTETGTSFSAYKEVGHAGTSSFSPASFSCKS